MSGFKKLFSGGGKEEDEPVDTIGADDDDGKGFMTESVKSVSSLFRSKTGSYCIDCQTVN